VSVDIVWAALENRRRSVNLLRAVDCLQPAALERAATVALTGAAVSVLDAVGDGMPDDTVVWPIVESAWPYEHVPALFVATDPITTEYIITSNDYGILDEPYVDVKELTAQLIVPPGFYSRQPMPVYMRVEDGHLEKINIDAADYSLAVDIHPDGDSTMSWIPWGEKMRTRGTDWRISKSTRRQRALVHAIATGKIMLADPDGMTKTQRRRLEQAKTTLKILRPVRIGDALNSPTAPVIHHRSHWTADGLEKRAMSLSWAKQICDRDPVMTSYKCHVCGKIHVGHTVETIDL
jgi:hypothetical protein